MNALELLRKRHDLDSQPDAERPRTSTPARPRSINVIDLVKEFHTESGPRRVLDGISFSVSEGDKFAILGRNGAGKSTLIQLLSGLLRPTCGWIDRGLRMSWPLALGGGFEGDLSGYDNIRFISKIYNCPLKETYEYVDDFTELGRQLTMPVRYYSSGMRMRLAFALSLAVDFECLLIDEVILVGDRRFQEKCRVEIFEKRKHRAMIMAIHDMHMVENLCDAALVLKNGRGRVFQDTKLATRIYADL